MSSRSKRTATEGATAAPTPFKKAGKSASGSASVSSLPWKTVPHMRSMSLADASDLGELMSVDVIDGEYFNKMFKGTRYADSSQEPDVGQSKKKGKGQAQEKAAPEASKPADKAVAKAAAPAKEANKGKADAAKPAPAKKNAAKPAPEKTAPTKAAPAKTAAPKTAAAKAAVSAEASASEESAAEDSVAEDEDEDDEDEDMDDFLDMLEHGEGEFGKLFGAGEEDEDDEDEEDECEGESEEGEVDSDVAEDEADSDAFEGDIFEGDEDDLDALYGEDAVEGDEGDYFVDEDEDDGDELEFEEIDDEAAAAAAPAHLAALTHAEADAKTKETETEAASAAPARKDSAPPKQLLYPSSTAFHRANPEYRGWETSPLPPLLLAGLRSLGFSTPTPIQADTLTGAMRDWKDVVGAAQTGSGKTLAFILPIFAEIIRRRQERAAAALARHPSFVHVRSPTAEQLQQAGRDAGVVFSDHNTGYGGLYAVLRAEKRRAARELARSQAKRGAGTAHSGGLDDGDWRADLCATVAERNAIPSLRRSPAGGARAAAVDGPSASAELRRGGGGEPLPLWEGEREFHDPLTGLVLTPTRELATQIAQHAAAVGRHCFARVATLIGGMALEKQQRALRAEPALVVATPGRLWELITAADDKAEEVRRLLADGPTPQAPTRPSALADLSALRFFVLDEADRMVANGSFPELENIILYVQSFRDEQAPAPADAPADAAAGKAKGKGKGKGKGNGGEKASAPARPARMQVFLFSATLTLKDEGREKAKRAPSAASAARARKNGKDPAEEEPGAGMSLLKELAAKLPFTGKPLVVDHSSRLLLSPTLSQAVMECADDQRDAYLYATLYVHEGRAVVFTNSISVTQHLTSVLRAVNIDALPLHAHMQQSQRLAVIDKFRSRPRGVIVATDVAARGIDIPNVELVIQYHVPRSPETYVHRAGRTARAGKPGKSVLLVTAKEHPELERLRFVLGAAAADLVSERPPSKLLTHIDRRWRLAHEVVRSDAAIARAKGDIAKDKAAAEEAGIEYDPDEQGLGWGEEELGSSRKAKKRRNLDDEDAAVMSWTVKQKRIEIAKKKAELKALLAQPIWTKFGNTFI